MTRVMKGKVEFIYLEPPGDAGRGIEFSVHTATGVEYHQVKRQRTEMGKWSLATLSSEGVLSHFYQKLQDSDATCVFVSTHAAHPLDELAKRARDAGSWTKFECTVISLDTWSKHFEDLHKDWCSSDTKVSFQRLKRVHVRTLDESSLRELVRAKLEALVNGDPATASDVLSNWALNQLHQRLTSSDIWDHLQSRGISQQNWSQDLAVTETPKQSVYEQRGPVYL